MTNSIETCINDHVKNNFFVKNIENVDKSMLEWSIEKEDNYVFEKFFEIFYQNFKDPRSMYDFINDNDIDIKVFEACNRNIKYSLCNVIKEYNLMSYFIEDKENIIFYNNIIFITFAEYMTPEQLKNFLEKINYIDCKILDTLLEDEKYDLIRTIIGYSKQLNVETLTIEKYLEDKDYDFILE